MMFNNDWPKEIESIRAELERVKKERDIEIEQNRMLDLANKKLFQERDELRKAIEMVCKIECVDDLWKAQKAIAKLGADKTGEVV